MLYAVISTAFKRFLLRSIYDGAKSSGASLDDALLAALTANFSDVGKGRILTATTVGGHSVSFQIPSAGYGVTPANVVEAIEELLTLIELINGGTPAPANDAAAFATALAELQPVSEFTTDHRRGRLYEVGA